MTAKTRNQYPERPTKSRNKSSEHIHSRRKTWLSDGSVINHGVDMSPRSGQPWWRSPLMKAARMSKLALLRAS